MPTYSYQCETVDKKTGLTCGHKYDTFFKSVQEAERDEKHEMCPKCSGVDKSRVFSGGGTGFILRGSGWAKDKYGK